MYTSPTLQGKDDRILYECPVGKILREAPHTYSLIDAASLAENATPSERQRLPRFYWQVASIVQSERQRLRELADAERQSKRDIEYAGSVMRSRRGG